MGHSKGPPSTRGSACPGVGLGGHVVSVGSASTHGFGQGCATLCRYLFIKVEARHGITTTGNGNRETYVGQGPIVIVFHCSRTTIGSHLLVTLHLGVQREQTRGFERVGHTSGFLLKHFFSLLSSYNRGQSLQGIVLDSCVGVPPRVFGLQGEIGEVSGGRYQGCVIPIVLATLIYLFLFAEPRVYSRNIEDKVLLTTRAIIPSLFPFVAITSFLLHSNLKRTTKGPFSGIYRGLFELPNILTPIVVVSRVNKFPVNTGVACRLLGGGTVARGRTRETYLFYVGTNPTFIVKAINSRVLKDIGTNILLCVSAISTSFFANVFSVTLCSGTTRRGNGDRVPFALYSPIKTFMHSINSTAGSMVGVYT